MALARLISTHLEEPGPVCEHNSLGTVPQPELLQDPGDARLHLVSSMWRARPISALESLSAISWKTSRPRSVSSSIAVGDTSVVTALEAIPGVIIGLAVVWVLGVRAEQASAE